MNPHTANKVVDDSWWQQIPLYYSKILFLEQFPGHLKHTEYD